MCYNVPVTKKTVMGKHVLVPSELSLGTKTCFPITVFFVSQREHYIFLTFGRFYRLVNIFTCTRLLSLVVRRCQSDTTSHTVDTLTRTGE